MRRMTGPDIYVPVSATGAASFIKFSSVPRVGGAAGALLKARLVVG